MGASSVRERCREALGRVEIPDPFDIEQFARQVAALRGRPVRLVPHATPPGCSGLCYPAASQDVIYYDPSSGEFHRDHVVLHELGHLLLEHEPEQFWVGDAPSLLPDLEVDTVSAHMFGRTRCDDALEQEAETLATLVHEVVHRRASRRASGHREDGVAARLRDALGSQGRGAACA